MTQGGGMHMSNTSQDWEAFGRNIQEIVERAVNSQNYQKLNQTVNRAVKVGGETLRKAAETAARSGTVSHTARPAANAAQPAQPTQPTQPALYDRTAGRTVSGVLKTVFGSLFALGGGITLLVLSAIAFGAEKRSRSFPPALWAAASWSDWVCLAVACSGSEVFRDSGSM